MNIAAANGKQKIKYQYGNTNDIVQEVIDCYKDTNNQVKEFAPQLKGKNTIETCSNVWHFIKHNIAYKIDPAGVQWIKTPARLWKDRVGDCKSFSVMAASLLAQNGITPTLRFTSYSNSNIPTHVYVVIKQGKKEIIVDAVYSSFNQQQPYTYKKDYTMAEISRLSGLENNSNVVLNSTPLARKIYFKLQQLEIERNNERKANGGTLPMQREQLYDKWIIKLQKKLAKETGADKLKSTISGGLFGNILGINDALRAELEKGLPDTATAFMYLFIGGTLQPQDSYQPYSVIDNYPTVKAKRDAAALCFWDLRGQIDNISGADLSDLIRNAITKKIGMTPKQFWTRWFNGNASVAGIGAANSNSGGSGSGGSGGGLPPEASIGLDAAGAFLGIPPGVLSGLVGSLLPTLHFTPAIASFAPQASDWAGSPYPIDKSLYLGSNSGGNGNAGGGSGGSVDDLQGNQNKSTGVALGLGVTALMLLK